MQVIDKTRTTQTIDRVSIYTILRKKKNRKKLQNTYIFVNFKLQISLVRHCLFKVTVAIKEVSY